jgi:L-fuculose-phosphate aldolase
MSNQKPGESMWLSNNEAKESILEIGRRLYARGLVAAHDGNISLRVSPTDFWVTPTGMSKGFLTPDSLVKLSLEGVKLAGSREPSSEVKMHIALYRENMEIKAVVHAHPPTATGFAVAGVSWDKAVLPQEILSFDAVPLIPYAPPGTEALANAVAAYAKTHGIALLETHGALTWGEDAFETYGRMESLEHYAKIVLYSTYIRGKPLY